MTTIDDITCTDLTKKEIKEIKEIKDVDNPIDLTKKEIKEFKAVNNVIDFNFHDLNQIRNIVEESWNICLSKTKKVYYFVHKESTYGTFNLSEVIQTIVFRKDEELKQIAHNLQVQIEENQKLNNEIKILSEKNKVISEHNSILIETNKLAMLQVQLATKQIKDSV